MKSIIKSGALALSLLAGSAFAQPSDQAAHVALNLSATGQLPVGGYSDHTGIGAGGLGGLEVGTYPGLALTARSGYIYFFRKDDVQRSLVPILGGAKYSVGGGSAYIAGELGATIVNSDDSNPPLGSDGSDHATYFSWAAGVGTAAGPTDIRLMFNVIDAADMTNSMTIGLTVGFNIWSM